MYWANVMHLDVSLFLSLCLRSHESIRSLVMLAVMDMLLRFLVSVLQSERIVNYLSKLRCVGNN